MRTVIQAVLRKIKHNQTFDIPEEWTTRPLAMMILHTLVGLIRGKIYSLFFRSSGGAVLVKRGAIIKNASYLSVGRQFIAEEGCEINALSRRGVTFGDRVTVGAYALIRPSNYYGGPVGEGLKVGDGSNIGPYNYIGCSGYIEIGKNVMIGPRVGIFAENHMHDRTDIPMREQGVKREFVRIEDDVWIATNSVILAGVTIGHGSVIAAGSVVTKDVEPYAVMGGVPARCIGSRLKEANKE
jgi:bifunctional N-acetylglucosamine-1-phosphate-uridyltransferase/glucosamine-1-phosphate-acetyltransferase GlmU-like protein